MLECTGEKGTFASCPSVCYSGWSNCHKAGRGSTLTSARACEAVSPRGPGAQRLLADSTRLVAVSVVRTTIQRTGIPIGFGLSTGHQWSRRSPRRIASPRPSSPSRASIPWREKGRPLSCAGAWSSARDLHVVEHCPEHAAACGAVSLLDGRSRRTSGSRAPRGSPSSEHIRSADQARGRRAATPRPGT